MAIIKLSAGERRRLSAFVTCLALAVAAWVFATLSHQYNFTIRRSINFKNSPQKRAFHSLQADSVNVTMKGTGWDMLLSKMNGDSKPISISLQSLDNANYVVISSQLAQIADKDTNRKIVSFYPDTLYFGFSNRTVKRVPIRLVYNIGYQRQFAQSNGTHISPDYVTLVGPSNRIDKIKEWPTDTLKASEVNETIHTRLNLQPVAEGNMLIYPKSVQATIPVDEFTEKTIDLPVRLINNTEYYNVKVVPKKVKVIFITSLKRYTETNEDFFEAVADLSLWKNQGYAALPVKLTRIPPFCKVVSVNPPNIDFIIKK